MFGWIPIIGPIIDGIVTIFTKKFDLDAVKYKTDGEVDIEKVKAQTHIVEAFKDQIDIRFARDILIYPPIIWTGLIVYAKIIERHYPEWVWAVNPLPESIAWLPYAVMVFLLGNAWINKKT